MRPRLNRWGPAIAAGLACLLPGTAARAQYSMGYDSFTYGTPPPQSYWANSGYQSMYTDPTTGVFAGNEYAGPRTLAPYTAPPYGSFPSRGGLPAVYPRPAFVAPQPATAEAAPAEHHQQAVVKQRRGLIRRRR